VELEAIADDDRFAVRRRCACPSDPEGCDRSGEKRGTAERTGIAIQESESVWHAAVYAGIIFYLVFFPVAPHSSFFGAARRMAIPESGLYRGAIQLD